MIERIRGILLRKTPTQAVVDVGGVAFSISIPFTTYDRLPALGCEASVVTHLHVRDDGMQLFGFSTEPERDLFLRLIGISGVGPKMALAILSRFTPDDLSMVVSSGDAKRLSSVKGIGQKTAERLIVELRHKAGLQADITPEPVPGDRSVGSEALRALEALGYSIAEADEAVRRCRRQVGEGVTVEEIIRFALKG